MANRVPSNLVKAQAKLTGAYQSSELRYRRPATYLALKQNTPIMIPNYMQLKGREDRAIETNFHKRTSRALLSTSRSHIHTGLKGDTDVLTPTWTTARDVFNMSLKQADNSLYNAEEQMFNEMSNVIANFAEGYETAATNYLFNNRSGVNVATANGTFNATDDVFQILALNKDIAIQTTEIALDANKYPKGATVFCDSISYAMFQFQKNQGSANDTNLAFQFEMNGLTFVHSIGLGALGASLAGAYTKGFWVVVPNGTVCTMPWIPIQNRRGNFEHAPLSSYSSLINPIDGEEYALHTYSIAADDTANNGYTQDVVTQYELSQDLAFMKAPLSVANETPIFAFGIV